MKENEQRGEKGAQIGDVSELPSTDNVELYMRSMAEEPLLTAEEEVALAKQIELGRESRRFLENKGLEGPEVQELIKLVEAGSQARFELARANTRLVVNQAKYYRDRGMAFGDLIQEGNVGLMRAVDKFEWQRGNRFSTYATWWIRQAISRALAQKARAIRIPQHTIEVLYKISAVKEEMDREGNEENKNDYEEIARRVGVKMGREDITGEMIEELLLADGVVSLNQPVGGEHQDEFGETLVDENGLDPEKEAEKGLLKSSVRELLVDLPERVRGILELRRGLTGGEPMTLEEVGKEFGLSRERIRQLEQHGMRLLKGMVAQRPELKDPLD